MELGTKYQRNNKKFKFELLVPQGKKLIKRNVYNSFDLIKETRFNNDFFYIVPIGFEFYYFPKETGNDELIWIYKCKKVTEIILDSFKKTISGKYRAKLILNNKIYYSQEFEADGVDKIEFLTSKIKKIKTSELFLQSFAD